jgi:hypothetical protein
VMATRARTSSAMRSRAPAPFTSSAAIERCTAFRRALVGLLVRHEVAGDDEAVLEVVDA